MINWCNDCGFPFETDQKWKYLCPKCWLKQKHPKLYDQRYKMSDITCRRCGQVFVDMGWKELCPRCYVEDLEEKKHDDLEEREQFK